MTTIELLQAQFNKERMNSQVYQSFANSLEAANWPGFAAWMAKQSADELIHAGKFAAYLIDRNEIPVSTALDVPPLLDGNAPMSFFNMALTLERENTASIKEIEDMADSEDDEQTDVFLYSWAIAEQTKSERDLVDALLELGRADCSAAMLILDREYGEKAAGG